MSHPIPPDAQRLADRLRMLADELEAAARYGVPIPSLVCVTGDEYGDASFHAVTEREFNAWAMYVEDTVTTTRHDGHLWRSVYHANVNGLPLSFSCRVGAVGQDARSQVAGGVR